MLSTANLCSKFDVPENTVFTYENIAQKLSKVQVDEDTTLLQNANEVYDFFFEYIAENIDFNTKTINFDDDFTQNLQALSSLTKNDNFENKKSNSISDGTSFFDKNGIVLYLANSDDVKVTINNNYSVMGMANTYAWYKTHFKLTPVMFKGAEKTDSTISATVAEGVLVNNNSQHKAQALAFIKYLLGDAAQSEYGGANEESIEKGSYQPVKKTVQAQAVEAAKTATHEDGTPIGIDNDFMQKYLEITEKINRCKIANEYFNNNVLKEPLEKYLNNEISAEQFVQQLTSKTKIYMEE
jgi:hypothetical protein